MRLLQQCHSYERTSGNTAKEPFFHLEEPTLCAAAVSRLPISPATILFYSIPSGRSLTDCPESSIPSGRNPFGHPEKQIHTRGSHSDCPEHEIPIGGSSSG
ncbi:MAG: hypothetical protein Q4G48_08855 [Bacteroidia bacterium]|nr:hypothetical protein [Bacteroidia bacterium]